jgi:hypothetical protein
MAGAPRQRPECAAAAPGKQVLLAFCAAVSILRAGGCSVRPMVAGTWRENAALAAIAPDRVRDDD